jgi:hypothetical protein
MDPSPTLRTGCVVFNNGVSGTIRPELNVKPSAAGQRGSAGSEDADREGIFRGLDADFPQLRTRRSVLAFNPAEIVPAPLNQLAHKPFRTKKAPPASRRTLGALMALRWGAGDAVSRVKRSANIVGYGYWS